MQYKTTKSAVTNKVRFYETAEVLNGAAVRINATNGRISGSYWYVSHPSLPTGMFDRFEGSLKACKEYAASLFN